MGKRKRASDNHNQIESSSDTMPCSSGMELLSEEKRLHAIDSSELKPLSSVLDIADSSMKRQDADQPSSTANHHHNLGRSIFLKRSRHHFGHHYSRRGSANLTNPSSSRGKGTLRDDKLSFKLAAQCNSELGRLAEYREKAFFQPERIRSSYMIRDAIPTNDLAKMVCGICRKALIRKLYLPDMGIATVDLSEVAVMACGHIYHAECLDLKTSFEDKRDPPCPSCTGSLVQVDEEREGN